MIDEGELDLAPDFQRRRVWRAKQKSLLIESILLRIPLPAFYFSADPDGLLQVVDGVQRLSTIYEFVRSKSSFPLDNLEYLGADLKEKRYHDIAKTNWSRRIFTTQIAANVIDPQTPTAVKFDIFRRINTGGSPLNAQEIRHCMSRERSRLFLKSLCELPSFARSVGAKIIDHVRMVDRELVLRFVAFKLIGNIDRYQEFNSMDDFLTETNRRFDNKDTVSDRKMRQLARSFDVAMENAYMLFGEHAFRKWPTTSDDLYPINRALFDTWSVLLADQAPDELHPRKASILRRTRQLMTEDDEFIAAISTGTSSPGRVSLRFKRVSDILEK